MPVFDELVDRIRAAADGPDARGAVRAVLADALARADALRAQTPMEGPDEETLHEDDAVSIWRSRFRPDVIMPAHEHRVPVLIACYAGAETSFVYTRTDTGLEPTGTVTARAGEIIELPRDAIHKVTAEGDRPSEAVHVYFGPLTRLDRALFDPATGATLDFTMENFEALQTAAR